MIVDAGANIGLFACFAAKTAPQSIVHAIEPMPATYTRLVKTVRANRMDRRIQCHNAALSSHPGEAAMAGASASQMAHVVRDRRPPGSVSVSATTLGAFVERIDVPSIDLLKMDIEGSEYDVLHAAPAETLRRFRRIVVEYHKPSTGSRWNTRTLARHLASAGFHLRENADTAGDYGMFHFIQ